MGNKYYIIIVEENAVVFEKIVCALQKLGCNHHIRRVCNQDDLDEELIRLAPDFVICDHSRSPWNSFTVLAQVRAFRSDLPLAVIGDGLDERTHSTLLAHGADTCVNDERLGELAPAVQEMLKRRAEQQGQSVQAIRRNFHDRTGNCAQQACAG